MPPTPTLPPPPRTVRRAGRDYALIGALGVLALIPGIQRGLTVDEYTTWSVSSLLPVEDLIANRLQNGHFPTYFLLMKGWIALAGSSEAVLRLPGAALTVASLLLFRSLLGALFGRFAANAGSLLFALHQVALWSGQTARPYAAMLFCSVAAAWALVRWWRLGRNRWLLAAALATAAGFLMQAVFAVFAAAVAAAALVSLRRSPRKSLLMAAAVALPLAALALPAATLAGSQQKFQAESSRSKKLRPGGVVSAVGNVAFGTIDSWAGNGWRYPAFALFIGLSAAAATSARRLPPSTPDFPLATSSEEDGPTDAPFPARALIWCWGFVPVALLAAAQAITGASILSHERYFVPALGGLIAVMALGTQAAQRWTKLRGLPLALALIAVSLNAAAFWTAEGDGAKQVVAAMKNEMAGIPVATTDPAPVGYEYRGAAPPVVELDGMTLQEASAELAAFAAGKPVWLFIYNNKRDPLDPLLDAPPPGYKATRRFKRDSARAALLLPE